MSPTLSDHCLSGHLDGALVAWDDALASGDGVRTKGEPIELYKQALLVLSH